MKGEATPWPLNTPPSNSSSTRAVDNVADLDDFVPANKGKNPAEPLTRDKVRALRLACNRRCATGLRNSALLAILHRSGMRISEALNLRPIDFDRKAGTVRVLKGKGGKSRTVPIDAGAVAELETWPTDPLFCALEGGRVKAATSVRTCCRASPKKAGVARRVHAHPLCHTYAAELAR